MFGMLKKFGIGAAVVAIAMSGSTAQAAEDNVAALTIYADVLASDVSWNAGQVSVNDNITCDPSPVVDGRMVSPRAAYVVGEAYANVEIAGHLKCVSLDTGKVYWLRGQVNDMYFSAGAYRTGPGFVNTMNAVAGAATVNPAGVIQYAGGSAALNTWHYTKFVGTTSTGRVIRGSSPLFYVAGV